MENILPFKKYHTLLFDLDGTLTNPKEGITKSAAYALSHFGINANPDELIKVIGPPLLYSFKTFFGLSDAEAQLAREKYRERFSAVGILENLPYEGMDTLLKDLAAAGYNMLVATSKPTVFAMRIIENFGYSGFFSAIIGAELNGARSEKDAIIEEALESQGIKDRAGCLMIGDREYDVYGAQKNGIDCAGVLYGFGTREELQNAGATYFIENVEGLRRLLL
jgi:phosphoglycolate phosphatase